MSVRRLLLAAAVALACLLLLKQMHWMHPRCTTQHQQPGLKSSTDSSSSSDGGRHAVHAPEAATAAAAAALPPGFRFKKVVAVIAYDRYEYFRQVIDSLRQAWGSDEYILAITIDGLPETEPEDPGPGSHAGADSNGSQNGKGIDASGDVKDGGGKGSKSGKKSKQHGSSSFDRAGRESIVAYSHHLQWLARNGRGAFKDVIVNASAVNLGVWPNKKRAVSGAMALSDFAIILEDDIVLERDALTWFEWHVTSGFIFERPDIAVATCWSTSFPYSESAVEGHDLLVTHDMGLLDKFWLDQWAQPWGWATWRRTWDAVGEGWNGQDLKLGRAIQAKGWFETMPLVARCNNIGSVGFHKQGLGVGHIHQRALTSASFPNLSACRYRELSRRNYSAPIGNEQLYTVARRGILPDHRMMHTTMEEHRLVLQNFREQHFEPSGWQSTC